MKANGLALVVALGAAFTISAAKAETGYYATADLAQGACGADEVVYVDLDRGRYYKKGTEDFGKSSNGVYACEKAAHAKYREGKSEPSAVATSK
ncbi:MAG TPA: hypothetical protein VKZ79_16790 [Alphaproteobacteria bacterium]|nr:hypothetical protein [Alphaproteobacteria bacterium]